MAIRGALAAVISTLAIGAAFAQQPRIDSITPSQGPIAGGTSVRITGANLAGATVRLDSTVVTPASQSATEVTLQMPPHDNGYVVISARAASGIAYGEYLYVPPRLQDLPPGYVTTVAGVGPYVRDYGPARNATTFPAGLALAPNGNLYVAEPQYNKISRVRPDGVFERFTRFDDGLPGFGPQDLGDGGPAIDAKVVFPLAVAVDPAGNVYIPDQTRRIRRVDAQTGIITTIAGNGDMEYSGDGGPAVAARLVWPTHIAADATDVFFIDFGASRIRRIRLSDGIISTFAGTGTPGFSGDGGPATSAQFDTMGADAGHLALDPAGNLYLADTANSRIRRIDRTTGVITTFYVAPPSGAAGRDAVGYLRSLAFDRAGNLYYGGSGRIVKVSPQGAFVTAWGNGTYALPVEGAPAATTGLGHVTGLAIEPSGDILFSDAAIFRVRRIDVTNGNVFTVAGIGPAIIGETGPAIASTVSAGGMAAAPDGSIIFGDTSMRLRRLDTNGTVRTVAGTGSFVGQERPAPALSTVVGSAGVVFSPSGEIEFVEWSNVGRIDAAGIVRDIVGRRGTCAYSGDGGPATEATLCQAWDAARDRNGNLFIADTNNNRIRRVDGRTGVITTVVGNGGPVNGEERYGNGRSCGDGGPAISACIDTPHGVAVDASGNLYVSEMSRAIRKVDASGTITTFTTVPSIFAKLVTDAAGNVYATTPTGIVRIDPRGGQTWVVGSSSNGQGFSGDGGPAVLARTNILNQAPGLAIDREGNLFFADSGTLRIRAVRLAVAPASAQSNYTALWWNPSESGWGLNFNHQGDTLFGTLFTYDASGSPMWLVMSNGARQSGETFSGALYRTTGPAFNANPFTPIGPANVSTVGTMTVTFAGDSATLSYTVNGITVNKSIQKQVYGARAATCQPTTSDRSSLTNYQDLWWNAAESGWGTNVTHQGETLFATLFTYDAAGRGLWLVMSAGPRQADGSYLGDLFQTTGPPFNAQPFTPIGAGNVRRVGTMQFRFTSGVAGTLAYSLDGINVTKSVTRQVFSSPVPACTS
jgi:sugar lactone lactonase YvrE